MPAARRPPPPVQVDFGRIAAATAFHATAASPTSKSGAFTSELLALKETGKISHKHSFLSRINSQESDDRYLEMQVDQTISVPIAQLRADAQVLEASIELQAQARRLELQLLHRHLQQLRSPHRQERSRLLVHEFQSRLRQLATELRCQLCQLILRTKVHQVQRCRRPF
jgi:hypothetical protein